MMSRIMHAIYIGTGIYDWVVMLRARRAGKGMADEEAAEVKTIEEKPSAPPPEVGEALPIPARTPTPPQISETEEGATPKAPSRTLEAGDGVKTNSPSEPLDAKGKERARYEID